MSSILFAQEKYLYFTQVNGLPRNITTCLEQDNYGYLWVGTGNGIVCYNGMSFYSYPELSGMNVNSLLCDSRDVIWAATDKGLFRLNRLTNYFELVVSGYIPKILEDEGDIYLLWFSNISKLKGDSVVSVFNGDSINDFCFSEEGIWLGTGDDGIRLLTRESGFKNTSNPNLRNKNISTIRKIDNKLFAGCFNGQLYCVLENGQSEQINISNHYFFREILRIGQEIWLATDGNGIIVLDKNLNYLKTLRRDGTISESINSNSVYDIFNGMNGEIWVASYGAGLTCILPDNHIFRNILPEKGSRNSLIANEGVSVFIKDPLIYFGTNYGLSAWNENIQVFKNLSGDQLSKELNGIKVTAIEFDENNTLWVGTYDGLLGKYSTDYELIETFHPNSLNPDEMQRIVILRELSDGHMLIVTQFQSRILLNFNKGNGSSEVFELYSKGTGTTYCLLNSIRENQQGELLALISDQGLFHINSSTNVLENRLQEMNQRIGTYISDFYADKKGKYWFASSSKGLLCVSEDGKYFKNWTVNDGLPSNTLIRIESVDDHFLWISSISGICRFDTETEHVLNFDLNNGLPANEFVERVSATTEDGRIIFGSQAGFTIIDPDKLVPDTSTSDVIISDITFQNKSIRNPEGRQYLKQPLEDTKELWLPYNKNSFSIHFFVKGGNFIKYHDLAYRLEGLEKRMNFKGGTEYTTYTNLSPGSYTFEIKSAEKPQKSNTTRLVIHIRPPWYLSWYAYLVYTLVITGILYLSITAYTNRIELKKEKEISEFKIQKEHELTEKKLEFFTNISHDLKSPLTLIEAPVSDLLQSQNLDPEQKNKLTLIRRNAKRLFSLISDLVDFRRLTQDHFSLVVRETNIYTLIEGVYNAFLDECENKSITLEREVKEDLQGFLDEEKIEKILWNLLSNALKFTNAGGRIIMKADEINSGEDRLLKIEIGDSGIGISDASLNKIFDRFYKVENAEAVNKQGMGIGLSIVKEIVELHRGTIQVDSKAGSGTIFAISIYLDKSKYRDSELTDLREWDSSIHKSDEDTKLNMISEKSPETKKYNLPGIIIVEDNVELRDYLADHLEKKYRVYQAEDGATGLTRAKELNPDIVLTDVQMPIMNGYEFCKALRLNFDTSHIPVVMLTANDTVDQQIKGLTTGADAYLTKPFEVKFLDAVLISLLENRKMLRDKFLGSASKESLEETLPRKDIDFLLKLRTFIDDNLTDQDLNLELLSKHLSVSLAQLNRKIKSLTGLTPNNLIKSIRLRKAYKLIREDGLRVSEAAYETGFSDPNYFTTCFKKEFGENPSQIL